MFKSDEIRSRVDAWEAALAATEPESPAAHEAQPDRTAEVRDPYARWCGRGGVVRRPPIPILDPERSSGLRDYRAAEG